MRKAALRLVVSLLAVGVAAAIVYGASALIARDLPQIPASSSLILTRTISGYIAAICLAPLVAIGLGLLFGDTVCLLIPARHERANLELVRYRKSLGGGLGRARALAESRSGRGSPTRPPCPGRTLPAMTPSPA